ncbi:metallophosphoesterase [Maribacter polysiphoniae]|uniref:metallophosphoesterase n=1 Tax=Maribacter polysiphoniae TaxID=429344 RepID=UPI0023524036|nr:metallophosphoesterase [Maribacter polysiphoniae]
MHKYYFLITLFLIASSCATYKPKYADEPGKEAIPVAKEVSHTFYLIGDAGQSPMGDMNPALKLFKDRLGQASANSTAIFLGDNIYPAGMPHKKDSTTAYLKAKNNIMAQLNTLEGFKGSPIFIPGNHDWYNEGVRGLEREQKFIEKNLDSKDVFFPEDGCAIQKIDINDNVVVIAIDTEWYLANWDKNPTINDNCEIKDREKFFEELEGLIKKNADKTTLIALHHPMFSYGPHGGQFSLKKQLFPLGNKLPLPIIGSLINLLRKTTGAPEDLNNKNYRELRKRIVTLAQYSEKVILASGHEHTLQYIVEDNTPQIVSGAGAKEGATRLINGSKFSTGQMGYAILEVYSDGSSRIKYYGVGANGEEAFLFSTEVLPSDKRTVSHVYPKTFPAEVQASVYTEEEVDKSKLFKTIWGERYRDVYAKKVTAPTVDLDTLFGGLTVKRKGGGHQSRSLRLVDQKGREYVMRALRKSAEIYLQAMAFKEQYVVGEFEGTFTESILEDFYTGAHPYAPFTVGELSDAVGIYHTNPKLYYIPKQEAIKDYTDEFGDELYMIEERTDDGHGDQKSFGYSNSMDSTDDMLKNLRKDEKYQVDEEAYIKARLFDMMIGDWDRHTDQWRWARFKDKEKGKVIYRPVPRDRDQVFSIMGDGPLMNLLTRIVPGLTLMEGFNEEIRSVKGFNGSPKAHALDKVLLSETTSEQWLKQARFIQDKITGEVIDRAFKAFPEAVRDTNLVRIKRVLLARKANLSITATEYYDLLNKYAMVIGTDKDDYFTITERSNGLVQVVGQRIKKGEKSEVFFKKDFDPKITKEVWIYGLDDDDQFEVVGKTGDIKVRLVGGQNNDVYLVNNSKKVYIYDQKAKKNTFKEVGAAKLRLTNEYETNTYQPINYKKSTNQIIPTIGSNPDDGLKIGFTDIYTFNGFQQHPFTNQHTFKAAYYFATQGYDFGYKGEFAHVLGKASFVIDTKFTSPNYSINFFGWGNETENFDDDLGRDYNRVKLQTIQLSPSLVWRGDLGAKFSIGVNYESLEVEETRDRYINTFYVASGEENHKNFIGADVAYSFSNTDNIAFPTMGMSTSLLVGYKTNTADADQSFGYVVPSLSFDYKLVPSGKLVLGTKWKAHFNLGDAFEFYQATSIGGVDGLRGYRNQRFSGKKSFYQNTDLRYSFKRMRTGLLPVNMGIYGGFDYGRVWMPDFDSNTWHTSYGGGFFLNASDIMSLTFALFDSDDGARFTFGLGFGF